MSFYIILAIVVVGMLGLTWWAFYLERLEDRDRRPR